MMTRPSISQYSRVTLVLAILWLAGCAAFGGDRSAGEIAEDSTIVAAVKARFIADKYVGASSVNVDAYKGVVTLTGDVLSFVEREQAERIAQAVRGVVKVENKLTVVD